jgi:chromosome segregation ATPase
MFSSISTFLSRRYNLSNSLSDRDRESLAQDVAYSLKHIPATSSQQTQQELQQEEQQTSTDLSVEDGNDDLETALMELETVLSACELSLQQFEKKERFLYVRIGRYREMIEGQACYIEKLEQGEQEQQEQVDSDNKEEAEAEAASEENDDEENDKHAVDMENDNNAINNEEQEQEQKISEVKKKHTQDEQKLQEVEKIHASIITQIELLKRRIGELEDKKQDIIEKREDCHQFLMQVAEKGI